MPEYSQHMDRDGTEGVVAYVLKGFPRLSEMFIASEISRLEQTGLRLRLIVLKPPDEELCHEVVGRINATPDYLPYTTSLKSTPVHRWLAAHLGDFLPGLLRVAKRRPIGVARAAAAAFAQAVRARRRVWSTPRKVYLKEFLQATAVADRLFDDPAVRHIHAHFCHGTATVAWLAAIITGLQFSFTAHAKDIYCESLNPAGLLRRKMKAAAFVVTCTETNLRHLQRLGNGGTPIHCVYHGLNADFTRLLGRQSEPPPKNGHLRALAVGRLVPKKGFDVFVEACAVLRQRGVPFEAVIVGESGEHEEEIRRRISTHNLDRNVRLAGPMSQARLYEEYRKATMFCLPCRVLDNGDRDGIPNVLMEAMACGLPIITTGISGIPEVVNNGVNGVLVPPDNPQVLANALLRLDRDRVFAQRLSLEAQATARERFDGDRFAAQLASLFREAIR